VDRADRRHSVALLLLLAAPAWGDTSANPGPSDGGKSWIARCAQRLAALNGEVVVRAGSPKAPFGDVNRFGQVTVTLGKLSAGAGDDTSGHRYRGKYGIEEKRYDSGWHSPFLDSENGEPKRELYEETHHRIAVGVLRGVVRGPDDAAGKAFAAKVKPIIDACLADVTPLEADPSLVWTPGCADGLQRAFDGLKRAEPVFAVGTCRRKPYEGACQFVEGSGIRFNASTMLSSRDEPLEWRIESSDPRRAFYGGNAMMWTANVTEAQRTAFFDAMRAPLEACAKALRQALRR
jgi:hypothetical protein